MPQHRDRRDFHGVHPFSALPWLTIALVAVGIAYPLLLGAFRPRALRQAPALLEGAEEQASDQRRTITSR